MQFLGRSVKLALVLSFICSLESLAQTSDGSKISQPELIELLDEIWDAEQLPVRKRDSVAQIHRIESEEAQALQKIFRKNHAKNIIRIKELLDTNGWPDGLMNTRGNWTICNVLQHSDQETRAYYIPMMKQAVLDKKLEVRFLVRAQDRLATDRGELQIYGGQMKYYKETKSFNVWPVFEPENIDKRRAEIGLGPIKEFLKMRFDFEWDLEEQIKRTQAFLASEKE